VYGLEIRELVIVGVDADAEEEAGVAAVDDFEGAEFDEVGLVFLVAGRNEAVDLEGRKGVWGVRIGVYCGGEGWVVLGEGGREGNVITSPFSLIFSSSWICPSISKPPPCPHQLNSTPKE